MDNEVGHCGICSLMLSLSKSESGTLEAWRIIATFGDPYLEMGAYHYRFCNQLSRMQTSKDTIWVIVDRLTKPAHFLPMKIIAFMDEFVKIYVDNVVRLYGVLAMIVSDHDTRFISRFWKCLNKNFCTTLSLSIAFHP